MVILAKKICLLSSCIMPLVAMENNMQIDTPKNSAMEIVWDYRETPPSRNLRATATMTPSFPLEISQQCLEKIQSINRDIPNLYMLLRNKKFIQHASFIPSVIRRKQRTVAPLKLSGAFKRLTLEAFQHSINDIQAFDYQTAQNYIILIDRIFDNDIVASMFLDEQFNTIIKKSNYNIQLTWENFSLYAQKQGTLQILLYPLKKSLIEQNAIDIAYRRRLRILGTVPTVIVTTESEFSKLYLQS